MSALPATHVFRPFSFPLPLTTVQVTSTSDLEEFVKRELVSLIAESESFSFSFSFSLSLKVFVVFAIRCHITTLPSLSA